MNKESQLFKEGYTVVRNLLPLELLKVMEIYFSMKEEISKVGDTVNEYGEDNRDNIQQDIQVENSLITFSDPLTDSLLSYLTPTYSKLTGIPLVPTYSFFRYYNKGHELKKHRDRLACEYSMSVPIGYSETWPILLTTHRGEDIEIILERGDALFYQGVAIDHWREPFKGDWAYQLFMHYADIDTVEKHPDLNFDERPYLGWTTSNPEKKSRRKWLPPNQTETIKKINEI